MGLLLIIMAEFDTGLPSIRRLQTLVRDKQRVEIKLISQDAFSGKMLWQDANCICLLNDQEQQILIWRESIVYVKPIQ